MRQLWDCIFTECTVCTQLDISPTSWSLRKLCTLFDHPRVGGGLSHIKQTCQNTSAGRSPSWLFCQFSWTDEWTALFFVNTNILFCKRSQCRMRMSCWYCDIPTSSKGGSGGRSLRRQCFLHLVRLREKAKKPEIWRGHIIDHHQLGGRDTPFFLKKNVSV